MIELRDYGFNYNVTYVGNEDGFFDFFKFMTSRPDIVKLKDRTG